MLVPNGGFAPPFPQNAIVNDGGDGHIDFVKGKTYRIRVINFAAFAPAFLHFDSHTMTIIMTDGSYVKQETAYQLRISPAQRYDILITALDRDKRNYPFLVALDINRDYVNDAAPAWPNNFTGQLVMNKNLPFTTDVVGSFSPKDDSRLAPYDGAGAWGPVTKTLTMNFAFCRDVNGIPRACFNGQPNIPQKVPTLYTAATTGNSNTNPVIYGAINPFIVGHNDIVDIVINNQDGAIHPFHLHGHQFQVMDRPRSGTGNYPGRTNGFASKPPRRDVVHVNANSYAVLRFKADNPGVFLFHCHIEWHVEMGLTATIIEAPELLAGKTFPADHLHNCDLQKIPTKGNAAGNTVNVTDTTGFQTVPDTTYNG
jgi:iron transport multicopper oxidase